MSKRFFSLLLALLLLFTLIASVSAHAAEDTVIAIRSAEDLISLSRNCTLDIWSKGKTVVLERDVDLSGVEYAPIPIFGGLFDGKGHTISGLKLVDEQSTVGFIRRITADGVVENLTISGDITPGQKASVIGGVAGENSGTVRNCTFGGTVGGSQSVGGICGVCTAGGVIENCRTQGAVSAEHRAGGIVGENAGVVRGCVNTARVNTDLTEATVKTPEIDLGALSLNLTLSAEELVDITDIGGVAGYSSGVIRACENRGEVGHRYIGYNVGGIVGHLSGYADACINSAKVYGRKDVGGVAGQIDPYTGWDFSEAKLTQLKEKLDTLRAGIAQIADDAASYSRELSEKLVGVMNSLSIADTALDTLSGDAINFINENIGSVNQLSDRAAETLNGVVPALTELGGFLDQLPGAFESLTGALDSLADASQITDNVYHAVSADINAAKTAAVNARAAKNDLITAAKIFIADPSIEAAGTLAASAVQKIAVIRTELGSAKSALDRIRTDLGDLPDAADPAITALRLLSQASDRIDGALGALANAEELIASAADALSQYDALHFYPVNTDTDARGQLFASLGESFTGFGSAAAMLGDGAFSDDVKDVSESFFDLVGFVTDAVGGSVSVADQAVIRDISSGGAQRTQGTVKGCRSLAAVDAETNCGGVAGAITIDISFDLEDEFHLSSLLSGSTKYLIYACVADCVSVSPVTAKKDSAGGIVGRMDYGIVMGCEASGTITAGSGYAGGIAGLSGGSVQDCSARVYLDADEYVGGIAGCGSDICGCYAMPSIARRVAYCGSIAGFADGEIRKNYYAESEIGGLDGISYAGKARLVTYEKLMEITGSADLFDTVTVTFLKDGEVADEVKLPFGGTVDKLPDVPDLDGKKWRWDDFDNTAVYRSLTVEGAYVSPVTVLATDEEPPQFLVEGLFTEGQRLSVTPYHGATESEAVLACTIVVDGCDDVLRVHLRTDEDGKLFTLGSDGGWIGADYTRYGSYIIFDLRSGGSFEYIPAAPSILKWILIGAGAAVVIAAVILLLVRYKRKSKRDE